MERNEIGKYLKYAIGEIILVVIGILIALYINNWNEINKSKDQLNNIYSKVELNLKTDLSNINDIIKEYEQLDERLRTMVSEEYSNTLLNSINANNYADCIPCGGDIISYIPFEIQDKGLELLKTFNDLNATAYKELSNEIIYFYSISETLDIVLNKLKEESFNNIKYFEQFPWYSDFMNGRFNPNTIDFFAKNEIYKNKVNTYRLLATQNYLSMLKYYQESATIVLEKIEASD
ncbi:MAG: DUF6090 family protein [Dokdonia sp.]|jgi:hypothetical protein|nr:hypothetical protein [Cytophagaceae bacterium]